MEWRAKAACKGRYELFLRDHEDNKGPIPKTIVRTCAICPVQKDCLRYVLQIFNDKTVGIYSGLSLREIRKVRQGKFNKSCPHGTRVGYFVWDCRCDRCNGVLV